MTGQLKFIAMTYKHTFYTLYRVIALAVLLLILLVFLFSCDRHGRITRAIDGDTFIFKGHERVRLANIDAPELSQPYGIVSKEFLKQYEGQECTLKTQGHDKYGRTLAVLYIGNEDINLLSVYRGLSWKFMCNKEKYKEAEAWARSHNLGLWSQPSIEPYIWRKRYKK